MQQLNIVRTSILCALFKVTSKLRKHFIRDTFEFVVVIYPFRVQFIYRISHPRYTCTYIYSGHLIIISRTQHLWLSVRQINPPENQFNNQKIIIQTYVIYSNQLEPINEFFMLGYMVCFLFLLITQGYFSSYLISNTNQPYSNCTYHTIMLHYNINYIKLFVVLCKRFIRIQQQDSQKTL